MQVDAELYNKMLNQLQGIANDLCSGYGFTSVQIIACTDERSGSCMLHAGCGSVHERYGTTKEFIEYHEETRRIAARERAKSAKDFRGSWEDGAEGS